MVARSFPLAGRGRLALESGQSVDVSYRGYLAEDVKNIPGGAKPSTSSLRGFSGVIEFEDGHEPDGLGTQCFLELESGKRVHVNVKRAADKRVEFNTADPAELEKLVG